MPVHRQTKRALRFRDLMPYRVAEVLLVSAPYDAFILEQDGHLTEQLFLKFSALSLAASPRFTRAPTGEAALEMIAARRFDLVITMTNLVDIDANDFGRRVKALRPDLPVVLLALDRKQLHELNSGIDREALDGAFLWSGDSNILLAIIKYVEDRKNVDSDIERGNVRVIIVAEDSPAYYSSFLGLLYQELMKQAQALYSQGVNEILRQVYMNSRPKILLATTYEEAVQLLERYHANVMAIISDMAFPRGGELDDSAGLAVIGLARLYDQTMPVLLQSAATEHAEHATKASAVFVDKNSPSLLADIRAFLQESLGFGDFIFRDGSGQEIDRARDLRELEKKIATVPVESIYYHAAREHFSIWLRARSEFRLAEMIRPQKVSDFSGVESARRYLVEALRSTHEDNLRDVVSDFNRGDFEHDPFSRLGVGSLGGKGRGMAFLNQQLAEIEGGELGGLAVALPKTVVVTTDYFDHFMSSNDLRDFAYTCPDDDEIHRRFLAAELSAPLLDDLEFIVGHLEGPLAVRSSSLLEDSLHQPLAGVYTTLMLPNDATDVETRAREAADALKLVYASTFLSNAKAYLRSTGNRVEEEKMAVIIQRLIGHRHGDRFYPCFSGVAQSANFYPVAPQRAEDGLAHVALGLGRLVVDGGRALMFSPRHPGVLPQFYRTKALLDHSQREFYALDMAPPPDGERRDLFSTVRAYGLEAAERDGTLALVGSVFDPDDQRISDDLSLPGPRVVTFNNILKHRAVPLTEAILELLEIGKEGLGSDVELEFACDMGDWGRQAERGEERAPPTFYVLQIRPFSQRGAGADVGRLRFGREETMCASARSLGNGVEGQIRDVVYVRRDLWDAADNKAIATEVGELNRLLEAERRAYLLIGPGRWGTSDEWLGIPVQWAQISNVRALVEASPAGYDVEVSQGAHFFHNITSLEVGYLSLPPGADKDDPGQQDYLDWGWLESCPPYRATEHLCWVRLEEPLTLVLDGRRGRGVIAKPGAEPEPTCSTRAPSARRT
ncbi:MAG: hypothetical protein GY719_13090 [bacterium]|nr:hypothetical protein [bacterium]